MTRHNFTVPGIMKAGMFAVLLLLLAGCAGEITVSRASHQERIAYGSTAVDGGMMQDTRNLLANFLLMDRYEDEPETLIPQLEMLFQDEPRPEYLSALADVALNLGLRFARDPDKAVRYYLSAALYSYGYLLALDRPGERPYNADRVVMMRIYNIAITEIFHYLRERDMWRSSNFTLTTAANRQVVFSTPQFEEFRVEFDDFLLCANFLPENLTHVSRRFGIGAPLIGVVHPELTLTTTRYAENLSLPATLLIEFSQMDARHVGAKLRFIDSRNTDVVRVGKYDIPLELDFSTPLAYMVRNPLPFGYLQYMLQPEKTTRMQGLYMLEPYNEKRIPVVLVHGLMSNIRTWMQMINTLQNDPDLRKYYQFWGFSYSTGNPILFSARMLRDGLNAEAERIRASGESMEMFNRMVLVGHSMGGLICKSTIMSSGDFLLRTNFGPEYETLLSELDDDQREFVESLFRFEPLPFVRRVVFIAVPHRGSTLAHSGIGRLGASLIQLPTSLVTRGEGIIGIMMHQGHFMPRDTRFQTGIDNLDPDNNALRSLNELPFVAGVPYHSIIGNTEGNGIPGGSDGVVPYGSSHLDGAVSETVVQSGHSVQQNPLAIQELRRILLEHLRQYPDLEVSSPAPFTIGTGADAELQNATAD